MERGGRYGKLVLDELLGEYSVWLSLIPFSPTKTDSLLRVALHQAITDIPCIMFTEVLMAA